MLKIMNSNPSKSFALIFSVPLLLLGLLASSCKKDEPDPPPTPVPCDKFWTVLNPSGLSAAISGGNLVLSAADSLRAGALVTVYQDSLRGDFTAEVSFSGFTYGTSGFGAFLQLVVSNGGPSSFNQAVAGIGTASPLGGGLQTGVQINDTSGATLAFDYDTTASTAGTFTLSRVGNNLSISVATATGSSSVSSIALNGNALTVGLQLGNSTAFTVMGTVSVQVNSFTLTGGGSEVFSDTFDCNSLL
jgi:hypothetical protein